MNSKKLTVYALILGGYLLFGFASYSLFMGRLEPLVKLANVRLAELYDAGSSLSPDYRATIEVELSNYGNVAARATVRVLAKWANDSSYEIKEVFTRPHSTIDVSVDLRATNESFEYSAEILGIGP